MVPKLFKKHTGTETETENNTSAHHSIGWYKAFPSLLGLGKHIHADDEKKHTDREKQNLCRHNPGTNFESVCKETHCLFYCTNFIEVLDFLITNLDLAVDDEGWEAGDEVGALALSTVDEGILGALLLEVILLLGAPRARI